MATEERPHGEQRGGAGSLFTFHNLVRFVLLATFIANQIPRQESESVQPGAAKTAVGPVRSRARGREADSAAPAWGGQRILPLARPGARFSMVISATEDLFEPIAFDELLFDYDYLAERKLNRTLRLDLSACAAKNCSADVHVAWKLMGKTFNASAPLIRFRAVRAVAKHHLIGSGAAKGGEGADAVASRDASGGEVTTYRAYIQPELTISPVVDFTSPLPLQFQAFTPVDHDTLLYGPAVYINNFWVIRDHLLEVNESTAATPFTLVVKVHPVTAWKVTMYNQFEETMKQQVAVGFATDESTDETKRIFLETNPSFLALTALVTVLHMLFEYLAFANDVRFWRGRKDFKGLSLRSVAMNCYFQTVIFLYLLDSNETSWTILLPSGLGVLGEYWKLTQCVVLTPTRPPTGGSSDASPAGPSGEAAARKVGFALSAFGYELRFNNSYDRRTSKHDETAVKWLIYTMIPILAGYSVYSAVYNEHKSWYSFVIHTQVQFIYFFGFAMMTPQIFINYKLKSVGQLPWRTFVYKSLNTVIDDLFAFIIKMPWLHRIACFRDDVVFVILLYQRWIYPVDKTRMADDDAPGEAIEEGTTAPTEDDVSTIDGVKKNQ